MNNRLSLHVDLISPAVRKGAIRRNQFLLRNGVRRIARFATVGIRNDSAHITVAMVYEEALAVRSESGKGANVPVLQYLFGGHEPPRAHDSSANIGFRLTKSRGGAKGKAEQKQCG